MMLIASRQIYRISSKYQKSCIPDGLKSGLRVSQEMIVNVGNP